MGGKKKSDKVHWNHPVVEAEYKISMHCNACERRVAKVISKIKGMEQFMTDMMEDRVVVTGRIDPEKVLKKLKKKTGKKVELVVNENEDAENGDEEDATDTWQDHYYGDETHLVFNDENVNSCTIM